MRLRERAEKGEKKRSKGGRRCSPPAESALFSSRVQLEKKDEDPIPVLAIAPPWKPAVLCLKSVLWLSRMLLPSRKAPPPEETGK